MAQTARRSGRWRVQRQAQAQRSEIVKLAARVWLTPLAVLVQELSPCMLVHCRLLFSAIL